VYFKYGNYTHAASEASVRLTTQNVYSRRGIHHRTRKVLTVGGSLVATSEATMTTAIAALETAYSEDGHTGGLYQTDGTLVDEHSIEQNQYTIGKVRVSSLGWPQGGGVYATNREFLVTLEAEYFEPGTSNILEFNETLRHIGTGGPRRVVIPLIDGAPQIQYPQLVTAQYAIQSGRSLGLQGYVLPNKIAYPSHEEVHRRDIAMTDPEYVNGTYLNYPMTWTYYFSGTNLSS